MLNDFIGFIFVIPIYAAITWLLFRAARALMKEGKIYLLEQTGAMLNVALFCSMGAYILGKSYRITGENRTTFTVLFTVVIAIMTVSSTAYCVSLFERKLVSRRGLRLLLLSLAWLAVSSPWLYLLWKAA